MRQMWRRQWYILEQIGAAHVQNHKTVHVRAPKQNINTKNIPLPTTYKGLSNRFALKYHLCLVRVWVFEKMKEWRILQTYRNLQVLLPSRHTLVNEFFDI